MRSESGQSTVEYAALCVLVAIVVGAAVALTSGGLGGAVIAAIRQGVCEVAAGPCPGQSGAAGSTDLTPCPLERKTRTEGLKGDVALVRLASRLGLAVERLSDGRVRVAFTDEGAVGVGGSVGAHVALGPVRGGAEASVEASVNVTSGRVWVLHDGIEARRFLARYGSAQRLAGRLKEDLRLVCPLCGELVGRPRRPPPPPTERWISGGLEAGSSAGIGLGPVRAGLTDSLGSAIGRRIGPSGTTWFLRVDQRIAGSIGAIGLGLDAEGAAARILALELDRSGQPRSLRLTVESRLSSRKGIKVPPPLRAIVGSGHAGRGDVIEAEARLLLAGPAERAAAIRLVSRLGLRTPDLDGASAAANEISMAFASHGIRTVRRWSLSRTGGSIGAGAGLGIRLGLGVDTESDDQRLAGVASKLPGLPWMLRADCLAL